MTLLSLCVLAFLAGAGIWVLILPSANSSVSAAKPSTGIDSLYGASLFRSEALLADVPTIDSLEGVTSLRHCLSACLQARPACKAFNYAPEPGLCILLGESLCANETYSLTPDAEFNYYDLMTNPEVEKKFLEDAYCQVEGKCSASCYPRKPLFVEEEVTRSEAAQYCALMGRKLAQPRNQAENVFYGTFGRESYRRIFETVNAGNRSVKGTHLERAMKEAKYWIGISDHDFEGFWLYDDGSPVSETFSAWAVAQPDNGGPGIGVKPENCAVMEMKEFNWNDVDCEERLHFFCA